MTTSWNCRHTAQTIALEVELQDILLLGTAHRDTVPLEPDHLETALSEGMDSAELVDFADFAAQLQIVH